MSDMVSTPLAEFRKKHNVSTGALARLLDPVADSHELADLEPYLELVMGGLIKIDSPCFRGLLKNLPASVVRAHREWEKADDRDNS